MTALTASLVLAAVWAILAFPGSALGGKGGGKGGKNTQLCLTFRDFLGDDILPPDAIQNDLFDLDGDGFPDPYCDGVDKVAATLDNLAGNLSFQSSSTSTEIRQVWIDVRACIDCPEGDVLPFGFYGAYIATNRDTDLRTLTPGDPTRHVGLRIRFNANQDPAQKPKENDIWNIIFGDNNSKFPCDIDDRVRVTAIEFDADGVPTAWTIEAFPEDVACLFHKDDRVRHISAPFRLTIWRP